MQYWIFFIIAFFFFLFSSFYLIELNEFFLKCPNKEMLLWDANIRMIQAIDILLYFKEKNYLEAIKILIDSPTWPPLRVLISIFLILLNGNPDPILDTRPSIIFFILLLFSILIFVFFFYIRKTKDQLNQILFYFSIGITITFLFLLKQITEYFFNSMLEIQGMLFYFIFIFYLLFLEKENYKVSFIHKLFFFFSGFLIYFTKYPYGILITLSFIFIEFLKDPKFFIQETLSILKTYKNYRIFFIFLVVVSILFVFLYPFVHFEYFKKKFIKNFIYFSLFIFFIEFNIYLLKTKKYYYSNSFRFVYKFFIFPFSIIILSHPDRFHSLLGAQSDTIEKERNFFISLFFDYFVNFEFFIILMILSFSMIFYLIYQNRKNISELIRKSFIIQIILFLWFHLILLEFTTTNHQARYIFQIIPPLILFHILVFKEISNRKIMIFIVFILSIIFIFNLYSLIFSYIPSKRNVCFAGTDTKIFKPVYEIKNLIPENTRGIIFNEFHEYKKNSLQLDNPYLFIPTDIDLHLRYKIYNQGFLINYQKNLKFPKNIDKLIYITYSCNNELYDSSIYKNLPKDFTNIKLDFLKEIDSKICLKIYSVK